MFVKIIHLIKYDKRKLSNIFVFYLFSEIFIKNINNIDCNRTYFVVQLKKHFRRVKAVNFNDKVAISTGAASGMGLLFSQNFAELGGNVVMCDVNEERLIECVEEINAKGVGKAVGVVCDVRDYSQVCHVRDKAVECFGRIDIMVNNAGITQAVSILDITEENLKQYHAFYGIDKVGVYVVESIYATDLKNSDRILSVNNVEVNTIAEIKELLKGCKVGDTLTIVADRKGETVVSTLTLQEYVPDRIKNNQK